MKYFELKYNAEPEIVGTQYPQVWDFIKGYSPENEDNGVFSLYYSSNPMFPAVDPDLSGFKLANGAKYTDFLSQGFSFSLFLFNDKAKEIIDKMNIESYRIYNARVTSLRKKMSKDYYLMKIVSESWRDIDFKNSDFYEDYFLEENKKDVVIDSYEDFCKKYETPEYYEADCYDICLKKTKMSSSFFKKELDVFMLSRFHSICYVSEKFVEEVNKNNLTGLKFDPVDF